MTDKVGDRIVLESQRVGQPEREGEILEIIEASYGTRYRVRWDEASRARSARARGAPGSSAP